MAKKYTEDDLGVRDIYGAWRKSAEEFGKILDANNERIKNQTKVVEDLLNTNTKGQKGLDAQLIAKRELEKLEKQALATDKAAIQNAKAQTAAEAKLAAAKRGDLDATLKLRAETNRILAAKRKDIKNTLDSSNAYKDLTNKVNSAQNKFKRLAAQYGLTDKRTKQARQTFEKLDDSLRKINNAARDGRRDVGRYGVALDKVRGSAAKVAGIFGVGLGAGFIARDSIGVVIGYEQAQANLASVLGKTIDETEKLSAQQKELGASTTFTAAQVAELQTELAKLGFTESQIMDMTESTLALAEASGTDLGTAASVAGATLRGFGLEAEDTQRVVDVMAKSFSSSSLDMAKFQSAMAAVAPVAKNMGLSIEDTTALIGTLTDQGIDASTAGTGLRNMFLDAQKAGLTLDEALEKINNSSDKTATSFDLFGKRGATLGVILAQNQEATGKLAEKLEDAEGAAAKMADTQRNTLGGALKLLRSAWEGFILEMNEAGGVGETLRKIVVFLADNLGTIVKVLGKLIKVFVVFKTTMLALKMADRVKEFKAAGGSLKNLTSGLKDATTGAKKMGAALKGIGLSVAITLVLELAQAWWNVASGAANAAKFQALAAKAAEIGTTKATKKVEELRKAEKAAIDEIRKRNLSREEELELIEEAKKATEDQLKLDIDRVRQNKVAAQQAKEAAKEARESFLEAQGGRALIEAQALTTTGATLKLRLDLLDKAVRDTAARERKAAAALAVYRGELENTTNEIVELDIETVQLSASTSKSTEEIEKQTKALKDLTDQINAAAEAEKELNELREAFALEDIEKRIDMAFNTQLESALETGKVRFALIDDLIAKEEELRRAIIERIFLEELEAAESAEAVQLATEKRNQELIRLEEEITNKRKELREDLNEAQESFDKERLDRLKEENAKIEEAEKESLDRRKEEFEKFQQFIRDLSNEAIQDAIERSQERQDLIQKEIDASKALEDELKESAKSGNATAQESLKAQEAVTDQKIQEKKKEAQREQILKEMEIWYNSILQFVDQGDSLPVATGKATAGRAVVRTLSDALFNLAGFSKGGYTGDGGKYEAKGIVHGGEFVIDKETTSQLGLQGASMADFKDKINSNVLLHQLMGDSSMLNSEKKSENDLNTMMLAKELRLLRKEVKNKKEVTFAPEVINGMATGVKVVEKEGSMTNVYRSLKGRS